MIPIKLSFGVPAICESTFSNIDDISSVIVLSKQWAKVYEEKHDYPQFNESQNAPLVCFI